MTTDDLTLCRCMSREALLAAGVPLRYSIASWDEITPALLDDLHGYCEDIAAHIRDGYGLTLVGPYGCGKTMGAVLALDQAMAAPGELTGYVGDPPHIREIRRPFACRFGLASELSLVLHHPGHGDNLERIEGWKQADFLVIDDFHKFYASDWDLYQLEALMDARHAERRATCLTLNDLGLFDRLPGVADRLRESSMMLLMGDEVESKRDR